MSNVIDERVVEMRFDNQQFESNVQTSLSTIDKLKQSLKFTDASQSLDTINESIQNVKMDGLTAAVETLSGKFSALGILAYNVLAGIARDAYEAGKQVVKSLTIAPITEGFQEYELKMDSVQTIMAGTGAPLDVVMRKLNELNDYADDTIYSFKDMTQNIGKFTNAGVGLDEAVAAIKGVSNVAALSGANTQQASHAMYNFAQALSAGYVKLIDWKSIENANMATVGFKNQLLETAAAIGTVKENADGTYTVLAKNSKSKTLEQTISATKMFNESLSYQWMTTDVLTQTLARYADETTEIGKKATAAAQDVKTYTQLMGTLREAVGSGWAETWEIIFGNFDEAKKLWTGISKVIGGFIERSTDARNNVLKEWKDLGGRINLIEGLEDIFDALVRVIRPIGEAFKEIFPPITGKRLADLTSGFRVFAASLKASDRTVQNIKNTFKGLFAVFDIIGQAFSAVFGAIKEVIQDFLGLIPSVDGGILQITGDFGLWLVELSKTIRENEVFQKAIKKAIDFIKKIPDEIDTAFQKLTGMSIGEAFDKLAEKASGFFEKIKEVFANFGTIDTSGVDTFSSKVSEKLEPLRKFFDGVKSVFSAIWEVVKKALPVIGSIFGAVGDFLGSLGKGIKDAIGRADFSWLLDIIKSGALIEITRGIKGVLDTISDVSKNVGGVAGKIKDILDTVKSGLESWQKNIDAKRIQKIAIALGILTLSLMALSDLSPGQIRATLAAMVAELVELLVGVFSLSKLMKGRDAKDVKKTATALMLMAGAIYILSEAMKTLSEIKDWDGLAKGIAGSLVLMYAMTKAARGFPQQSNEMVKISIGLIIFASALRILFKLVKNLGEMDVESLAKGLIGVGVLCAELVYFLNKANFNKLGVSKGIGFIFLALSLRVLQKSIKDFAEMDWKAIIKGLTGVGVLLGELGIFTRLAGNAERMMSISTGMILVATAILMLEKATAKFATYDQSSMIKGFLGVGMLLAMLGGFTKLVGGSEKMLSISTGMVILGAAMAIFVRVVAGFGNLSWEQIAKGLISIGISLAAIAVALRSLPKDTLALSAGLVLVGAALKIIASATTDYAYMSWDEIAKGLTSLVVSLAAFAVALNLMKTSVGGAAALLISAIALKIIAPILAEIGPYLEKIADTVINIIIKIIAALPRLLGELAKSIDEAAPSIGQMLITLAETVLSTLNEIIPNAVETLLNFIEQILSSVADHIPSIISKVVDIIVNVLDGVALGSARITESIIDLFKGLLDGIAKIFGDDSLETILKATVSIAALTTMMGMIALMSVEAVAATALLPKIGGNLNEFIKVIKPFLKEIQKVNSNSLQGAKSLGEMILALTGASILDALTSWFTKEDSFVEFGKKMADFAPYIADYYKEVKDIDPSIVEGSANAAKAMAELAKNLPNSGGLSALISGDNSLAEFAEELTKFGPSLKAYADSVTGLDASVVVNSTNAASAISEFAENLPNSGGLSGLISGENSLSDFADELVKFGPSLKAYADSVEGVKPEVVTNSANAAKSLSAFAESLPKHGGFEQLISGDNQMIDFIMDLPLLGSSLAAYSDEIKDIKPEAVTSSAAAAESLAAFVTKLPKTGGIKSWFEGEGSLVDFAIGLKEFGPEFANYASSVEDIKADVVDKSVNAAMALAELAENLPNSGGISSWLEGDNKLSDFAKELAAFGPELKNYSDSVDGVDSDIVINSVNAAKALAGFIENVPNTGGLQSLFSGDKHLFQMGVELAMFGPQLKKYSDSIDGINSDTVIASASAAMALTDFINAIPNTGGIDSIINGDIHLADLAGELAKFGPKFKTYSYSVDGIKSDVVENSANAAKSIFEAVANLPKTGGIKEWINGEQSLSSFADELVKFGPKFKEYSDSVDGVKEYVVVNSANAAKALFEMVDNLPESSKLADFFTNKQTLSDVSKELVLFGPRLKRYSDSVDGLKSDVVENSANAAKALFEMTKNLPESGKISDLFKNKESLSGFADELVKFGPKLKEYSESVDGLKSGAVTASADAAKIILEFANNLPAKGGLVEWFKGDDSLTAFAKELTKFGPSLVEYADSVDGLNTSAIYASANVSKSLADFASGLPDQGGIDDWFTGDLTLSGFAEELSEFGPKLKDYSDSVTDIDINAIGRSVTASKSLTDLAKNLPEKGSIFKDTQTLSDFGKSIASLSLHLGVYYTNIKDLNNSKISSSIKSVRDLMGVIKDLSGVSNTSISGFGAALSKIGNEGINKFITAFTNAGTRVRNVIGEFITGATKAISDRQYMINGAFRTMMSEALRTIDEYRDNLRESGRIIMAEFVGGITNDRGRVTKSFTVSVEGAASALHSKEYYDKFYKTGKYYVDGFVAGISDYIPTARTAAKNLAKSAMNATSRTLEEKSPSKAMYRIGSYAGQGFVNALDDFRDKAFDAGTDMANSAKNGLGDAIKKISDLVENGIDSEPTIRPIMDLSDIQSKTNQLYTMMDDVNGYSINGSYGMANTIANGMNKSQSTVIDRDAILDKLSQSIEKLEANPSKVFENTFNITGNNPREIADEISRIIQRQVERRDASWA